jgi:hypothetical protein
VADIIDLPTVRAALARLDVLTREHPDLSREGSRVRLENHVHALDASEPMEEAPAAPPDETR